MQILNASIIFYAFDKLNNLKPDTRIYNSTNFMISCLYNAITEYYSDSDCNLKLIMEVDSKITIKYGKTLEILCYLWYKSR